MNNEQPIAIPEGEYANYLANLAADIADKKTRERDTRWRTISGLVVTLFALFGYTNFSSIRDTMEKRIETVEAQLNVEIDKKISEEVTAYIENNGEKIIGETIKNLKKDFESRLALLQLVIVASEMRQDDSFTNEARGTVVSLLEIVSSDHKLAGSDQFAKPLEDIVDSFLGADLESYIDDIDNKLRDRISSRQGIVGSMLHHYGLRILGAVKLDETAVARLRHYATAYADRFNSPELSAPYLLGLAFIQAGHNRDTEGEAFFEDARYWTAEEREIFVGLTSTLKNGDFYKEPTGKTKRVEKLMSRVFEAYEPEFRDLMKSPPQIPES